MGKVIGLTGGIASGKSTVSNFLRELGAEIFDADQVARELFEPDSEVWAKVVAAFGEGILNPDRTINRVKLGEIVFNDPGAMATLNKITHPAIIDKAEEAIDIFRKGTQSKKGKKTMLALDVPLLFEVKMDKLPDEVWVVYVPPEVQVERLIKRNNLTREEALARLAAQMPIDEKKARADIVIDNRGSIEETRQYVLKLWEEM